MPRKSRVRVQIPLWSMNTPLEPRRKGLVDSFRFLYGRWIPYIDVTTPEVRESSDSSMVDEYLEPGNAGTGDLAFRFLYGRWIRRRGSGGKLVLGGSDSSMVDEYHRDAGQYAWFCPVQIPLWSMNTPGFYDLDFSVRMFRFLYGRWIPRCCLSHIWLWRSSDSSMVDEYPYLIDIWKPQ